MDGDENRHSVYPSYFCYGTAFFVCRSVTHFIALFLRLPLLFPRGKRWFQLLVCLLYFAFPFTLMIYGEQYISSGLAAIIFANMPIVVLLVSMLVLKEKLIARQWVGLLIGILSITLILLHESDGVTVQDSKGVLTLIAAVIMHAVLYVASSKYCQTVSVVTYNAIPCLAASLILLAIGWWCEMPQLDTFTCASLAAVVYLGVVAGVFGILSYLSLQRYAPPFQASLVFLIFPLIAVGLESFFNGRSVWNLSLILVVSLLIGIVLIKYNQLMTVVLLPPVVYEQEMAAK